MTATLTHAILIRRVIRLTHTSRVIRYSDIGQTVLNSADEMTRGRIANVTSFEAYQLVCNELVEFRRASIASNEPWEDQMANQDQWHFCKKCGVMQFAQGPCVQGGQHEAQGSNFNLPHSIPEAPFTQRGWRFCNECHGLFFDGVPGKCEGNAGGPHTNRGLSSSF